MEIVVFPKRCDVAQQGCRVDARPFVPYLHAAHVRLGGDGAQAAQQVAVQALLDDHALIGLQQLCVDLPGIAVDIEPVDARPVQGGDRDIGIERDLHRCPSAFRQVGRDGPFDVRRIREA